MDVSNITLQGYICILRSNDLVKKHYTVITHSQLLFNTCHTLHTHTHTHCTFYYLHTHTLNTLPYIHTYDTLLYTHILLTL